MDLEKNITLVPGSSSEKSSQTERCPGCRPKGQSTAPKPGCEGEGLTI